MSLHPRLMRLQRHALAAMVVKAVTITALYLPTSAKANTTQVSFDAVMSLPSTAPDKVLFYGQHPSQFVEFWHAKGLSSPAPVVVLAHGGCWLDAFSVDHVRPAANRLAELGFAVWAIEYRRLGNDNGGWPQSMDDIVSGLHLLSAQPPNNVDLTQVAVVGHSAGGHLALLAVERSKLQPVLSIGLAAITNIQTYAEGAASCNQAAAQLLLSADPEVADDLLVVDRSDLTRVLFFSAADTIVAPEQAQLGQTHAIQLADAGHFDFIHPHTPAWQAWVDYLSNALNHQGQ